MDCRDPMDHNSNFLFSLNLFIYLFLNIYILSFPVLFSVQGQVYGFRKVFWQLCQLCLSVRFEVPFSLK